MESESLLKDNLPALPSPGSLQQMIATPPSTTPQSTAVPATLSQSSVNQSRTGKVLPPGAIVSGKLPCTPPIEPGAAYSPSTATPFSVSDTRTYTPTTITKPPSSSSLQQVKSSKPTTTSASSQRPKTSSATTKSQTVDKLASGDSSEKVFIDLFVTL